jgi:hypothetical protein
VTTTELKRRYGPGPMNRRVVRAHRQGRTARWVWLAEQSWQRFVGPIPGNKEFYDRINESRFRRGMREVTT